MMAYKARWSGCQAVCGNLTLARHIRSQVGSQAGHLSTLGAGADAILTSRRVSNKARNAPAGLDLRASAARRRAMSIVADPGRPRPL